VNKDYRYHAGCSWYAGSVIRSVASVNLCPCHSEKNNLSYRHQTWPTYSAR